LFLTFLGSLFLSLDPLLLIPLLNSQPLFILSLEIAETLPERKHYNQMPVATQCESSKYPKVPQQLTQLRGDDVTSLPAGRKTPRFEKWEGYNDLQQLQLSQYMHTCCVTCQSSATAIYEHLAPSEYKKYRRIVV
jgi:hypothetical protein